MKIILIGNFLPDKQESMKRFADTLHLGFTNNGYEAEIWYPNVFFSFKFRNTLSGLGKWLGYLDKWILYPVVLFWQSYHVTLRYPDTKFHICDHSNSLYLKFLPKKRTSITCHDVLAIRGALGFADAYCVASFSGKILQKLILNNLKSANRLATVSLLTLNQLRELTEGTNKVNREWRVIHNAFNGNFYPMKHDEAKEILNKAGIDYSIPFILHVGSNLPRKNRKLLVNILRDSDSEWKGNVIFAGQEIDKSLKAYVEDLKLQGRVISIIKPDHLTLVALYSLCYAFVFPSFSEGFGWPVIEAQACGAPVLASDVEPMIEVSGGAAIHCDPLDSKAFVEALLSLKDTNNRIDLIDRGYKNCTRFGIDLMIESYLSL